MPSEFDYYPMFQSWLEFQGYTVIQRYAIDGMDIDILGYRKFRKYQYTLAAIEVKAVDVPQVIHQAIIRQLYVDYSYCAFWINDYFSDVLFNITKRFEFLKDKGIGVLIFDDVRKDVWVVLRARKNNIDPYKRKYLLKTLNLAQTKLIA